MSKVAAVAWRDFKQTVLRKIFLLAVLGIPLLMLVVFGVVILMMFTTQQEPRLEGTIAILDPTGEVAPAVEAELDPSRLVEERRRQIEQVRQDSEQVLRGGSPAATTFRMGMGVGEVRITVDGRQASDEAAVEAAKEEVLSGTLLAAVVVPAEALEVPDPEQSADAGHFDLHAAESLDLDHVRFLERRLGHAIVRARAKRAGLDPDWATAMMRQPEPETTRVLPGGQEAPEQEHMRVLREMIPMIFMLLLWGTVISSAQHLMMSTIEEKSNRVMEVLLSAVTPLQLMSGKIIGIGGVGLLIVGIYSLVGVGGLVAASAAGLIDLWSLLRLFPYLFVFFFMAYFMIASIMAAVGSAVSDIREANTLVTPVMFVVMIPLFLWFPITHSPNGALATVCSFIPPAVPFVMILRVTADETVPLWQIPVTIAWGYLCTFGMIWMAARIFRVGVLMYGKPPSPIQLLKWVRYV